MTTRPIAVLLLLALTGACGAPAGDGAARTKEVSAVWQFDDDANLAYPACGHCGADVDRGVASCDGCGARVRTETKSIACPECKGSKACDHCASAHACIACAGTNACSICDGSGARHGEVCPECEAGKTCCACAKGAATEPCERCDGTHVCANCEGEGAIVLK